MDPIFNDLEEIIVPKYYTSPIELIIQPAEIDFTKIREEIYNTYINNEIIYQNKIISLENEVKELLKLIQRSSEIIIYLKAENNDLKRGLK